MQSDNEDPEREAEVPLVAREILQVRRREVLAEEECPGGLSLSQQWQSVGGVRKADEAAQAGTGHCEVEEGRHRVPWMGVPRALGPRRTTLGAALSLLVCGGIVEGKLFLQTSLTSSLLPFLFDEIPGGLFLHSLSIVGKYKNFSKSESCQVASHLFITVLMLLTNGGTTY